MRARPAARRRLSAADPLILTLGLDRASFERFEALRRAHFPPALNRVPAHVTLFHHLPGEALPRSRTNCARWRRGRRR
jgi:hypothetical protein